MKLISFFLFQYQIFHFDNYMSKNLDFSMTLFSPSSFNKFLETGQFEWKTNSVHWAPTASFDDGFLFNQARCSYIFVRFQKIWLQAKKSIVTEYIVVWILECGFLLPSHKCLRLVFKLTKLRYHPAILIFVLHQHNVHGSNEHNLKFWN